MTKAEFKKIVADGVVSERCFLAVKIETEGNPFPEIIINPMENLGAKMTYYEKAYTDEDLELISAKNAGKSIRIVDALMFRSFNDLNWFAY